jgi:hypothetical protein
VTNTLGAERKRCVIHLAKIDGILDKSAVSAPSVRGLLLIQSLRSLLPTAERLIGPERQRTVAGVNVDDVDVSGGLILLVQQVQGIESRQIQTLPHQWRSRSLTAVDFQPLQCIPIGELNCRFPQAPG